MGLWFTQNLGDATLAGAALEQIKELFLLDYEQASAPEAMAVYLRHESHGGLHCQARVYFSPAAASVAMAVQAEGCPRPAPGDLGLLVGSEQAWAVLFPGSKAPLSAD